MRSVICVACVMLSNAVMVNAQDFTSEPAKLARDNYKNTLSKATSTYKRALETALRQAESRKDDEEVDRIAFALLDLADDDALNELAPDQVARLSFKKANPKPGSPPCQLVGKVAKGDKIVVTYFKGMFGFHGEPVKSPDETDVVGCVLMGKQDSDSEVVPIAKIPKGTRAKPFEYTFDAPFKELFLQTTPHRAKPAGEVTYKYAIIRAK